MRFNSFLCVCVLIVIFLWEAFFFFFFTIIGLVRIVTRGRDYSLFDALVIDIFIIFTFLYTDYR